MLSALSRQAVLSNLSGHVVKSQGKESEKDPAGSKKKIQSPCKSMVTSFFIFLLHSTSKLFFSLLLVLIFSFPFDHFTPSCCPPFSPSRLPISSFPPLPPSTFLTVSKNVVRALNLPLNPPSFSLPHCVPFPAVSPLLAALHHLHPFRLLPPPTCSP